MISHACPHGSLFYCKVCEFGDCSGYLELDLGPTRSLDPEDITFFECGPRHPGALADLEDLLSREEQRASVRRYLGHPAEEDLLPGAARNYALSEALKEKMLHHLLVALSTMPSARRPQALTLFAWYENAGSGTHHCSWVSAFLNSDVTQVQAAIEGFQRLCDDNGFFGMATGSDLAG